MSQSVVATPTNSHKHWYIKRGQAIPAVIPDFAMAELRTIDVETRLFPTRESPRPSGCKGCCLVIRSVCYSCLLIEQLHGNQASHLEFFATLGLKPLGFRCSKSSRRFAMCEPSEPMPSCFFLS